jgi:hypothetical protein
MYALLHLVVEQTELAHLVHSGKVFVRPFAVSHLPEYVDMRRQDDSSSYKAGPTTFPERSDVLIGTRFDAPFLGSFNRFLDFHPGNRRWIQEVAHVAYMPLPVQAVVILAVVDGILDEVDGPGVRRFLRQDPTTGSWRIMTRQDAIEETLRAVAIQQSSLLGALTKHLKYVLADARFGVSKETTMARRFGPMFVDQFMSTLFKGCDSCESGRAPVRPGVGCENQFVRSNRSSTTLLGPSTMSPVLPLSRSLRTSDGGFGKHTPMYVRSSFRPQRAADSEASKDDSFQVGTRVWANENGDWYEAAIIALYEDNTCLLQFNAGGEGYFHIDDLRKYVLLKEGDYVEVDFSGDGEEFFSGTIVNVHPNGRCAVEFDDGDFDENIRREYILLY